jgi:hypothetical protein
MRRAASVFLLLMAACGGGSGTTTSSTVAVTTTAVGTTTVTTVPAVGTTVIVGTTVVSGTALEVAGTVYTIDWSALVGPVVFTPPGGGSDPFFHVHNSPAHDGFFFSVEAYTVYGSAWSGELGTFEIGCFPAGTGICVHFDPDGPGPAPDLGADYMVTGTVEILQADAEGFVAVFTGVAFSDGSTIPGLFTVSG